MALPDALMPCLSSSVVSALNESIRVSNAASQLAVPFMITTFLDCSESCSPKGSAAWTVPTGGGAGVWAAEGGSAGDLVSAGGGTGDAAGADGGLGEADGAGDCASTEPANAITANGTSAAFAARQVLIRFIRYSPIPIQAAAVRPDPSPREAAIPNTQVPLS